MALSRFGGLWTHDGVAAMTLDTTPVLLTLWDHAAELSPGVTCSLADDGLHIKVPGFYVAYCSLSFAADAGEIVTAEFRVNGLVGAAFRGSAEGLASGGRVNVMFLGAAKLDKGDVVQVYVYSSAASTTFTLVEGQFGLFSI